MEKIHLRFILILWKKIGSKTGKALITLLTGSNTKLKFSVQTYTHICSHCLWVGTSPFTSLIPSLSVGFSWCLGIECRLNENVISFGRHLECRKLKFISVFLARMRRTTQLGRKSGREVAHWGANSFDCGLLPRLLSCYQTQTANQPLCLCKFTIDATPCFWGSDSSYFEGNALWHF